MARSRTTPRFDRYWAARLPLPAYFGVVTVLYGVLTWAFDAAGDRRHANLGNLVLHVVVGALFGAVMTGVVALQRRRSGGATLQIEISKAVRSGRVPATADAATWSPVLRRRIAALRRCRWLAPVLMAPLMAFAVVAWVLAPDAAPPAIGLLALSLGLVVLSEVQAARSLPRAGAVLDRLQEGGTLPRPPAEREPAPVVRRPPAVLAATALCGVALVAVATEVVRFLLSPGDVQTAIRMVGAQDHVAPARAEQLGGIAVVVLLGYWAVLLAMTVTSGAFAFTGRNWARGLLVPTALLGLVHLLAPTPTAVVTIVALTAAVVALYLPASSAFVASRRSAGAGILAAPSGRRG